MEHGRIFFSSCESDNESESAIGTLATDKETFFTVAPDKWYEAPLKNKITISNVYSDWGYTPTYDEGYRVSAKGKIKSNGNGHIRIQGACPEKEFTLTPGLVDGYWYLQGTERETPPETVTHFSDTMKLLPQPHTGWDIPTEVEVSGTSHTYSDGVLTLWTGATTAVTIAATCPLHGYKFSGNITNGTMPTATFNVGGKTKGFIESYAGYIIPATLSADNLSGPGGQFLGYTRYNDHEGMVEVRGEASDLLLTASCTNETYPVTYSYNTNTGSISPKRTYVTSYYNYEWTITPKTGYQLPQTKGTDITVAGIDDFSYDKDTGVLSLSDPLAALTISFTCAPKVWDVYDDITHGDVATTTTVIPKVKLEK